MELPWENLRSQLPRKEKKFFERPPNWRSPEMLSSGYVMWRTKNARRGYLLETITSDEASLWAFELERVRNTSSGAIMCDLCKYVHSEADVGTSILTFRPTKTISRNFIVCADLQCSSRYKDIGVNSMRETMSPAEKLERFEVELVNFLEKIREAP
ncbi:MAG: FBP domain-containing protein [Patescibacteria group bacterium UBA2103]